MYLEKTKALISCVVTGQLVCAFVFAYAKKFSPDAGCIIIALNVPFLTGKLLSKTQKIAYNLLNKVGQKGEVPIKPGDRVALVYPNNDPISFICGFYGCLMAAVVPVPVEVPTSRRVCVH